MEHLKTAKYSEEFKRKAIDLAEEIGVKEAVEKLGLSSSQTIGAWKRFFKPRIKEDASHDLATALKEIKRLKKELAREKHSVAILREATAFFLKDILK